MSKKQKNVPKLRFPEFRDSWKEEKLDKLVEFSKGKGYSKADLKAVGTPIILYGRLYTKYETVISDVDTFADCNPDSIISSGGEVIVPASGETAEDISIASVVKDAGIILGGDLNIITPMNEIDSVFLALSISNGKPHYDMAKMAQGKSVVHLHNSDLSKIQLVYPIKEEQRQIGEFFSRYDTLITLQQRKVDQIKEYKNGMLQKMFPKEGETVPEVRFPGFSGEWKKRTFGDDIVSIQTGTNLLGAETNNGTPLLKMGNIQRGYFDTSRVEYLDEAETVEAENIVYYGDFLFNTRNTLELVGKGATWLGESGKYAFNSNIARFKFKEIDTVFFNYLYNTENLTKQVHARATGTTSVAAIYPRALNSLTYYIPSREEQSRLGKFFTNLDTLITLHQRKLEAMKEYKKGLLQQMFV